MSKQPLVSVITRTRNRPELLAEAVASVAAQTWPQVEHIIVNDGGCNVDSVLAPYLPTRRIVLLEPGAVGRCKAGNLGLQAAQGEWIAWLDDDDLYYPQHLTNMVPRLVQSGLRVGYSDPHCIRQSRDSVTGAWTEVSRTVPFSRDFSRIMLVRETYIHLVTFMHHRECTALLGGFDEGLEVLEDLDLFFRLAQNWDFLHVAEVSAAFRIRDDQSNAVTALRKEFVETRTKLFQRYIHIAFAELLGQVDHGQALIGDLRSRVAALEAQILRGKGDNA
ncbi:MAG: glycosyltransferase [Planctomycetes bacterium]|nr:glycosyltransferase [Planctomycetota bacterium]